MKREKQFNWAVDTLVKAYQNDTLEHGDCAKCAVGNLIAEKNGYEFSLDRHYWENSAGLIYARWDDVFLTGCSHFVQPENYKGKAKRQIDSTGYTWQELAQIEKAFETAPKGNTDDDWMFNGLMAVVDVLMDIHDCREKEEATKQKFIRVCKI